MQYGYNTKKQLSSITRNGFSYSFLYDIWGNMTDVSVGSRTLSTKSYNPITGNLSSSTYGNGWTTNYNYDYLGRLVNTTTWPAGGTPTGVTNYSYNKLGQLTEYYDSLTGVTQRYNYDSIGRITSSLSSDGSLDVDYSYDDKGRLLTRTYVIPETGSMTNSYRYNSDGYLIEEETPMSSNTYTVDKFGRITQRRVTDYEPGSTAHTTAYTYLAGVGGTDATTTLVSNEVISDYGSISYNYDTVGNVEYLSVNRGGTTKSVGYAYDTLGQLKTEHNELNNQTVEYTYDAGGNITSKTTYTGVWGQKDASSAVTDTYAYTDTGWKDLLTAYNGQTITYDTIGNPLTYRRGETMTWSDGRKLTNVYFANDSANGAVSFSYDSSGMRISKSGPRVGAYGNSFSVDYFYDGDTLVK